MSREILQTIIDDFSPEKFSRFLRNKNRFFAPQQDTMDHYNDESFKDGLKLGEIKFSETEKLIVCTFKVKQSLSERSGKKAQYEKGKKILKETQSDAGILIFYDPHGNFRFSLIYPETIGNRRQWSNFRRFTYFVSPEFTNKTYLTRIGDENLSSLENIKEAFSVEKVTKEFYLEYRKLFENLVADLQKNHTFVNQAAKYDINTENFAKKLLGQIVFIYFIQKKGWMGVPAGRNWGEGDKNFLANIFKEAMMKKSNFFNDYLEKLFYGTLNNPRRNAADPSFSKEFNCRIPFLNGGLFEAEYDWKNSFIYLDNDIFKNIFEVFDRFNFTVEEESPDDKEIAVDPEMLGKVFENLLPENLRKGKGTYYTPREIVYYMCQESLVNYLDAHSKIGKDKAEKCVKLLKEGDSFVSDKEAVEIDNLLQSIKICDPACGSGAFLVGMLNEVVRLRLLLRLLYPSKLLKKSEYELKKDAIHNCIYGVDIDPGAIEIAKLRLWLALVVDYEIRDIEPLPNLDYRLMCGNSLLEEFEGVKFYNGEDEKQELSLFVDTRKRDKVAELKKKVEEYFDIHDDEEKLKKRKEINDIKDWLIKTALEKRKKELASQRKMEQDKVNMLDKKSREKYFSGWGDKFIAEAKINEVLENLHNPKKAKPFFIWKLEFIDVFEDKGGFDVVIANPPYVSVKEITSEDKKRFSKVFETGKGRFNLFTLFLEKGHKILKQNGIFIFILPEGLYSNVEYQYIREYLLHNTKIILISLFTKRVFEAAVDTSIICAQSYRGTSDRDFPVFQDLNNRIACLRQDNFSKIPYSIFSVNLDNKSSSIVQKVMNNKAGDAIENILEIQQGIIYSGQAKGKVFNNIKKNDNYKKVLDGRDVLKWVINWKNKAENKYIHYSNRLHRARDERLFLAEEKLLLPRKSTRILCAYDNEQYYCLNTAYVCLLTNKGYKLKFILGVLNSKLINYVYSKLFFGWQITIPALNLIVIPKTNQNHFAEIIDKILAIARSDDYLTSLSKQTKLKEYEHQMDKMIYKLYELSENEIETVEKINDKVHIKHLLKIF